MTTTDEILRYPIGRFDTGRKVAAAERPALIAALAAAPEELSAAVAGLGPGQLDTPYREGGWTVRQVVHHVPDSHMNAYVRFKWGLTEDEPLIRTYDEKGWADLDDVRDTAVETSLQLLAALHERWVTLLRGLTGAEWDRTIRHPELDVTIPLSTLLAMYAWHGRHHTAHITSLRERMGW